MAKTQVDNMGEALDVFIQTAKLAQRSGILTLEDAVIVKSAIDFVEDRVKEAQALTGANTAPQGDDQGTA
jgi:flagellar motor component MotA